MATYAPRVQTNKYSWKKGGMFELKVTTGDLPPWLDKKVLRAAQAAGSTLDWDLRHKPDLWKAVELWAWKKARLDDPKQPTLFTVDREDPMTHLDMADFLGEAKVVALAADCTDRFAPLHDPIAYIYTLVIWFSIDVEKAFFGQQGEKILQRRKLQWVLDERSIGHLTLNYMQATQVDHSQEDLGLDDDEDDDTTGDDAIRELGRAVKAGEIKVTVSGGKDSVVAKLAGKIMEAAEATGLAPEKVLDLAKQAKTPEQLDRAIAGAILEGVEKPFMDPKKAPRGPAYVRDFLAADLAAKLAGMSCERAEQLATEFEVPLMALLEVARGDNRFTVSRQRVGGTTGSIETLVWLKNRALQPMFEDAAHEERRLVAVDKDLVRLAQHALREAGGDMNGMELLEAVCALQRDGNISRMLARVVSAAYDRIRGASQTGHAFTGDQASAITDDPWSWSKWRFVLAGGAHAETTAPEVVAQEPDAPTPEATTATPAVILCNCESFRLDDRDAFLVLVGVRHTVKACTEVMPAPVVKMPDLDAVEDVETRMANMDKRVLAAMVESLRNACFTRAAYMVTSDCNLAVTCDLDDVMRIAAANPDTFKLTPRRQGDTGPARIELISNPTIEAVQATIAGWVHAAPGYRLGKGELHVKIQKYWDLRLPSIGKSWLDLVMRGQTKLVDLGFKGIGIDDPHLYPEV